MTPQTEISKDYRLNDVVLKLQEEAPVLDRRTGEEIFGVVTQDFSFSASYRVGEQALLARPEEFGGLVLFDAGFAEGTETMSQERAEHYTTQYLRWHEILKDVGEEKDKDPNARVEYLQVTTAVYDTPQPSLDGFLPLNAFEVKGRLTKTASTSLKLDQLVRYRLKN